MVTFFGNNSRKRHPSVQDIINIHKSGSEYAHAYETLIDNLNILNASNPLQTILVTSARPLEGKTTVATNLAVTMMLSKKRVLIVDTDLRRPNLHEIFEVDNDIGFADLLQGNHNISELIQSIPMFESFEEETISIDLITSGKANQNLFHQMNAEQFKSHIAQMKKSYDLTIFDSPPVLAVTDALLMAPLVQGVIMVLSTGVVTEEDVISTKQQIQQAGGNISGVVMNRFDEKLHGPGLHAYYKYYGK